MTVPARGHRRTEAGQETLQAVLVVGFVLLPVLVSIITFGMLVHTYIGTQAAAAAGARSAGSTGGFDAAAVRNVDTELTANGIDAAGCSVSSIPATVRLGEPIEVTVVCPQHVGIPLIFATDVALRSTYVARGEVNQ